MPYCCLHNTVYNIVLEKFTFEEETRLAIIHLTVRAHALVVSSSNIPLIVFTATSSCLFLPCFLNSFAL